MAIGDKVTYKGEEHEVFVNFNVEWGRYRSMYPSSLIKTVLYQSEWTGVMDYEWVCFTGFHEYWI